MCGCAPCPSLGGPGRHACHVNTPTLRCAAVTYLPHAPGRVFQPWQVNGDAPSRCLAPPVHTPPAPKALFPLPPSPNPLHPGRPARRPYRQTIAGPARPSRAPARRILAPAPCTPPPRPTLSARTAASRMCCLGSLSGNHTASMNCLTCTLNTAGAASAASVSTSSAVRRRDSEAPAWCGSHHSSARRICAGR